MMRALSRLFHCKKKPNSWVWTSEKSAIKRIAYSANSDHLNLPRFLSILSFAFFSCPFFPFRQFSHCFPLSHFPPLVSLFFSFCFSCRSNQFVPVIMQLLTAWTKTPFLVYSMCWRVPVWKLQVRSCCLFFDFHSSFHPRFWSRASSFRSGAKWKHAGAPSSPGVIDLLV